MYLIATAHFEVDRQLVTDVAVSSSQWLVEM